nr:glycine zipper 2TM domain-containing protein [uncultured Roseateles sp.]
MTNSSVSSSASQRYIGIALLAALLAGVYALGRSQSSTAANELAQPVAAVNSSAALAAAASSTEAATALSALPSNVAASATPRLAEAQPSAKPAIKPSKPASHQAAPAPVAETHMAAAEPEPSKPVARCEDCATVLSVKQVVHEGQASGLGAVGGAVLGGLLGNQVGGGNGKKLATVGAAAAGGYFGNEMEKKRNARTVWVVKVSFSDNSTRSYEYSEAPRVRVNDMVRVRDGELTPM